MVILIGNKISNAVANLYDGRITKVSRNSLQNKSEIITNEYDKEYLTKDTYLQKKGRRLWMI